MAEAPLIHDEWTHILPAVACVIYLLAVHVIGPWYQKNMHPDSLPDSEEAEKARKEHDAFWKFWLKWWNLMLTILSIAMLFAMIWPTLLLAYENGPKHMLCDQTGSHWVGVKAFAIYVFQLSKYAELIDTLFLIMRNKPVGFLHWYHHTTVLYYTWYAGSGAFNIGYLFAIVNCCVHTIMYWYYFRRACGVMLSYDKLITRIQIIQMVIGVCATGTWAFFNTTESETCSTKWATGFMLAGLAMYGSYFYLFFKFYINRYNKNKAAKRKSQ
jgi:elongation of very long chain fatty acids protein 6